MPEDLDGKEEDTEQLFVLREGGEGAGEEREGEGMEVRRGRGEGAKAKKETRVNEQCTSCTRDTFKL